MRIIDSKTGMYDWLHEIVYTNDSIPKDTIMMIPNNFALHEIKCIEETKNGYIYTTKLYPYYEKKKK